MSTVTSQTDQDINSKDLRMLWQEHIRRALGQPYLVMLMVGSLMLSAASFFTTFMGMLHFMPVILVTFCIVFAIQALLFVTSWRIGFALADREEAPIFTLFVFVICLGTSVFFSWVALFESINDEDTQARTRQVRIQSAVEETVAALKTRGEIYQRDQMEALITSPAFVSWTNNVDRVSEEAMGARGALEASRDRLASDTAARIQALEAERARIMRGEAADSERVASNERALERIEQDRQEIASRVSRLRQEVADAEQRVVVQEGLMEGEETGGGDGRSAGRGPVWRELRDQRNIFAAERDAKKRLYEGAQIELNQTVQRMEELRVEIAAANASQGQAELSVLDRRMSELQSLIGTDNAGAAASLEKDVEAIRSDIAVFTTQFNMANFDSASARCADLLETMRAEDALKSRVAGLSCDRSALAAFINPVRNINGSLQTLAATCSPDGSTARNLSQLGFEQAVDFGRGCIDSAGLPPAQTADLRAEITRLVDEEDPNASQFVKTVNGFSAGDKLNYLALGIALFIDLLVLFSGLIGALSASDSISRHFGRHFTRTQADNFIRALEFRIQGDETMPVARALMKHMKPYIAEKKGFWQRSDDSLIARVDISDAAYDEERAVMLQFLLEQYAQGHAVIDEDTSDTARGRYIFLLRKPVIDAVRDLYLRKAEDQVRQRANKLISKDKQAERAKRESRWAERRRLKNAERMKNLDEKQLKYLEDQRQVDKLTDQRLEEEQRRQEEAETRAFAREAERREQEAEAERKRVLERIELEKLQAEELAQVRARTEAERRRLQTVEAEMKEQAERMKLLRAQTAPAAEPQQPERRTLRLRRKPAPVQPQRETRAVDVPPAPEARDTGAVARPGRSRLNVFGRGSRQERPAPERDAPREPAFEEERYEDEGAYDDGYGDEAGRPQRRRLGGVIAGVAGVAGGFAASARDMIDRARYGNDIEIGDDDYDDDYEYDESAADDGYYDDEQDGDAGYDDDIAAQDAGADDEIAGQRDEFFDNIKRPNQPRSRRDEWSA